MKLSPTLHRMAMKYNAYTIVEDNIDFWYDSLNDCYRHGVEFELISMYLEAIDDEDTEQVRIPIDFNVKTCYSKEVIKGATQTWISSIT